MSENLSGQFGHSNLNATFEWHLTFYATGPKLVIYLLLDHVHCTRYLQSNTFRLSY